MTGHRASCVRLEKIFLFSSVFLSLFRRMQLRRFAVKLQKCGNVTWLSIDMGGEYNNLIFIFGCTYPLSLTCATSLDWSVVWNWAAVPQKIHEESCAQTFSRASNWILMDAKRGLWIFYGHSLHNTQGGGRENSKVDDFSAKASVLFIPQKARDSTITNHILTFGDFEKNTTFPPRKNTRVAHPRVFQLNSCG